tara:strand:- start:10408 stop:12180 length:1773 start_codon:yes stop_codon:yes gene_type:complete
MGLETNVCRRGHVYYLRARVPKDLVSRLKRREIWKSLGERHPNAARALAANERLRLFQLFDFLRATPLLTDDQIQICVKNFFKSELEFDAEQRRTPGLFRARDTATHKAALSIFINELREHSAIGEFVLIEDESRAIAQDVKIDPEVDKRDFQKLQQYIARTKIDAARVALARWDGDWTTEGPLDPLVISAMERPSTFDEKAVEAITSPPIKAAPRVIRSAKTVNEVLNEFLKERDTGKRGYEPGYRQSISWFTEHFGTERTIDSFTWEELHSYAELLRITPARRKIRYPKASLLEAIELNKVDKHDTLDLGTINNTLLGNLTTLFSWALKKRYISVDPSLNIKIDIPKRKAKSKRRVPFSISDLNEVFRAPNFVGCQSYSSWTKPGDFQIRDHRFWLPLIGAYTGARLGEIAQLLVTDVFEEDGIWFFRIADTEDADDTSEKEVKNSESRRCIPVHTELQKVGFLTFVADARRSGVDRLFPNCERSEKTGKFDPYSKLFRRLLNSAGITDSRKVFHSFRHSMEDAMREAALEDSVMYRLSGRTLPHSSAGYGSGDTPKIRRALKEAMSKIEYEGLDLSHLYGAYPPKER